MVTGDELTTMFPHQYALDEIQDPEMKEVRHQFIIICSIMFVYFHTLKVQTT